MTDHDNKEGIRVPESITLQIVGKFVNQELITIDREGTLSLNGWNLLMVN